MKTKPNIQEEKTVVTNFSVHLDRLLFWHLLLLYLWHRRLPLAVNAQVRPAELWEVYVDVAMAIRAQRLASLVVDGVSCFYGSAKILICVLHEQACLY